MHNIGVLTKDDYSHWFIYSSKVIIDQSFYSIDKESDYSMTEF